MHGAVRPVSHSDFRFALSNAKLVSCSLLPDSKRRIALLHSPRRRADVVEGESAHLKRTDLCRSQIEEVEGKNGKLQVVSLGGLAG